MDRPPVLMTIGHSTHSLEEFVELLHAHGVKHLVDVRTIPRSRRHPHFNRDALPSSLAGQSIAYTHLPGLGGLRKPRSDSMNLAWRNQSFRGYADYMQTAEFAASLELLIEWLGQERTAVMCAEALPWRCHRSLIADALLARGYRVEHIQSRAARATHTLTRFARVDDGKVFYPAELGD